MEDDLHDDNTARFHFDPDHNVANIPTVDAVRTWLREEIRLHHPEQIVMVGGVRNDRSWRTLISRILPRSAARERVKDLDEAVAISMVQVAKVHLLMREFAVDLTRHHQVDAVSIIAHIPLTAFAIGNLRQTAEKITSAKRRAKRIADVGAIAAKANHIGNLETMHATLRRILEAEAIKGLISNPHMRKDGRRYASALASMRDEVQDARLQDHVEHMLREVVAQIRPN